MNTLELAEKRVKLRKVSSIHGGEWQGPCPGCNGKDRFHVWPEEQEGRGRYWCRVCEKSGDNIQFLIEFDGMTFKEAIAYLRITMPERPVDWRPSPPVKPAFTPRSPELPADLWQERARKLIAWAQGHLKESLGVMAWLAARGINAQAASDYSLGWNPGEDGKDIYRARNAWGLPEIKKENGRLRALWIPMGLVIPWISDGIVHRIRIRRPEGDPRYYVLPGSTMSTMLLGRDRRAFVAVEAELDAIAVMENNRLAGAVGLGSVSARPTAEAYEVLKGALQILVSIDYDAAGAKEMAWWKDQFSRCDRWPVPQGKDPGEAFAMGIDLDKWIRAGLPPALTIGEAPRETKQSSVETKGGGSEILTLTGEPEFMQSDTPPLIAELHGLLRKNPGVRIINTPDRFTVLRDGRYVGGRINHLVFHETQVREYILSHPAESIGWENLIH